MTLHTVLQYTILYVYMCYTVHDIAYCTEQVLTCSCTTCTCTCTNITY